jgi:hypothetical protein
MNSTGLSIFNCQFSTLLLLLTPVALRKKRFAALVQALSQAPGAIHAQFVAFSQSLDRRTGAQTCYMQALLNDEFDFYDRRITVRNAPGEHAGLLLCRQSEDNPMMLGRQGQQYHLLNRDGQTGMNRVDFEVAIPAAICLTLSENERLKRLVNRYKLVSKKYAVTTPVS